MFLLEALYYFFKHGLNIIFLILLLMYVIQSIFLMNVAKNQDVKYGFLSWIPGLDFAIFCLIILRLNGKKFTIKMATSSIIFFLFKTLFKRFIGINGNLIINIIFLTSTIVAFILIIKALKRIFSYYFNNNFNIILIIISIWLVLPLTIIEGIIAFNKVKKHEINKKK